MRHGGSIPTSAPDLTTAGAIPADWLDLSTGIAPTPYPFTPPAAHTWTRLPQESALQDLLAAARHAYGAAADLPTIAAPGTQILIQLLPILRPQARVAVVGPTYSEHAICWQRAGADVAETPTLEAAVQLLLGGNANADGKPPVIVVGQPNNPDGRTFPLDELRACAKRLAARGGLLVVDEAFADTAPETSLCPTLATSDDALGIVVLRSFGKFYGLAGVRLGFALGCAASVSHLGEALGPWAVPGPAIAIGCQALRDGAWAHHARARYRTQAAALDDALLRNGLEIVGGTTLYRLCSVPDAHVIAERLKTEGVLVRWWRAYPHWLRFGLPGTGDEMARLSSALAAAMARSAPSPNADAGGQ